MSVYVDNARLPWRGKSWCHLVADSVDELHSFAQQLGLKRAWFQSRTLYPHYDVTVAVQSRALSIGALAGDKLAIITCAKQLRRELLEVARLEREEKPEARPVLAERVTLSSQPDLFSFGGGALRR